MSRRKDKEGSVFSVSPSVASSDTETKTQDPPLVREVVKEAAGI